MSQGHQGRRSGEEAAGHSRHGDLDREPEASLQVAGHGGSLVPGRRRRDSLGGRVAAPAALEAPTRTEGVLADVVDLAAAVGPHGKVLDDHVLAGRVGVALELDGPALGARGAGPLPVAEGHVGQLHAAAGGRRHRGPRLVDVERVGVAVPDELAELGVLDVAGPAVALDHEHLVAAHRVDLAVGDVGDGRSCGEGPDC